MRVARRPGRDARERHRAVHRARSSVERAVAGLTGSRRGKYPACGFPAPPSSHVHFPVPACRSEAGLARVPRAPARRRRAPDRRPGRARARRGELGRRIEAALAGGVRWLILDLAEAVGVSDAVLDGLVEAAGALRARKGELIVAGAHAERRAAARAPTTSPTGPAVAANVDQAVMILKMLRPEDRHPPPAAAREAADLVADAAADRAAPSLPHRSPVQVAATLARVFFASITDPIVNFAVDVVARWGCSASSC